MEQPSRRGRLILLSAAVLLALVPLFFVWRTGYIQRPFGFAGFPARIAVFVHDGGHVLKPDG